MNDAQRIHAVRYAAERVGRLADALDTIDRDSTLVSRIREAEAGLPAQRFDAQRSGPTVPDPTYVAALRGVDPAAADLGRLDRTINQLVALSERAWDIVDRYPPSRSATDADRLALARENDRKEPGCQSCARIEGERGGPRWEPVHPKLRDPTDVGGRLERSMLLCRWCWDCVAAWGRLPSGTELVRHHRGERVGWPRDVERPA